MSPPPAPKTGHHGNTTQQDVHVFIITGDSSHYRPLSAEFASQASPQDATCAKASGATWMATSRHPGTISAPACLVFAKRKTASGRTRVDHNSDGRYAAYRYKGDLIMFPNHAKVRLMLQPEQQIGTEPHFLTICPEENGGLSIAIVPPIAIYSI